ncbi:MAG: DEAD/DEAH box helicase [Spirochaetaceae bacterium]|jgi:superfamily II DNA/RNA helicase|nr:DEAD/DEAH box helicase [Spirochaetaceae bacterium]
MESFADLGVKPWFINRLTVRGIGSPTAIQSQVIPSLLAGKNLIFRSATGTGKTFAYLIPLFQRIFDALPAEGNARTEGDLPAGLVMCVCAPTYELCSQIKGEADFLLEGSSLKAGLLIGSANISRQIEGLKKNRPGVIVGNPGRLLQLARMGKLRLNRVGALVLDEGDRLTADELFDETRELVNLVNPDRITTSCSATIPAKSRERLLPLMGRDVGILDGDDADVLREWIEHWALFSEDRRKIGTLRSLLAAARPRKALVFTARSGQVGNIVSQLQYHHIKATGLYGDMDKKKRKQALDDFRANRAQVLVTSDLAARGLDIPGLSHVIALDVPGEANGYIHRAGRTGRAGKRGVMVTLGDEGEMRNLAALEKKLGIVVYPKVLFGGQVSAPDAAGLSP